MVTKTITAIINASLSQSKVPGDWKAAYVIPLFKKGRKTMLTIIAPYLSYLQYQSYLNEWCILN